ncbi:unnamed protein product [Eruca vesicaria subsp. sativa]|uniref:KIB1-4 beta-propeller domain-containing protein n=1 Tax=Eruca vesicaria subsp. sativa TaxID=29727 RepID=A0ABC8KSA3_ERUVS|nr:unnamed protein product [Eruca vesicaria subsp. sativa]
MGKWSELPSEIIHSISLRIDNLFDLIHFRSVCSFWRSSSLLKVRRMPSLRCPLPLDSGGYGDDCHILRSRVYRVNFSNRDNSPRYWLFKLREKENGDIILHGLFRREHPSVYGWLSPNFTLDLINCQVLELAQDHVACYTSWFEPFESVGKQEGFIGFMSLDAENNEFMILGKLSFNRPAAYRSINGRWTELEITPNGHLEAILSYKNKFYAIDRTGITIVVEPTLEVSTWSRPCDKTRLRWLVKSGDKVLLVEMCTESWSDFRIPNIREKKIWFEISELDEENNNWIQVEDIDGRVLFLEQFCSISCLVTEIQGFRANSIIFMDLWGVNNTSKHEGILVYEFNEQGVRSLADIPEYVELFPSPPGWIVSNG